jgi:hypothetical protein
MPASVASAIWYADAAKVLGIGTKEMRRLIRDGLVVGSPKHRRLGRLNKQYIVGYWVDTQSLEDYAAARSGGAADGWEYEHGQKNPTRRAAAVLYGLLTAADVGELERRQERAAIEVRCRPLPLIDGPRPLCPDCRRAAIIESHVRLLAAGASATNHDAEDC